MPSNSSTDTDPHERQFPNEIIDEVVDHLQDDSEALKAVSLSSRIFLHRARKHLFSILVLRAPRRNTLLSSLPSRKIFRLIKSAPHLIPYIQVLIIAGNAKLLKFDEQFSKALGIFQRTLETEVEASALRHLYLYNMVWTNLTIDARTAIERLLGLRSLKIVTFYVTHQVPWTVFKVISPNVKVLCFDSASFSPNVESEETDDEEWFEDDIGPSKDFTPAQSINESAPGRLSIESLSLAHDTIGNDPTIILADNSVCPLNLTHLHTVLIKVESDYWWIRQQEFVSHVGRSLETLGIDFTTFFGTFLPPLDCRQLNSLNILDVQIRYKPRSSPLALQAAFLWLCESLETLPRQHQLQLIDIRCTVGGEECRDYRSIEPTSWPEVKKGLGWGHIDQFLAQPRFNSFSHIRVALRLGTEVKKAAYTAFLRSAPILLPRLIAKGVVVLGNKKVPLYRHTCILNNKRGF